MANQGFNKPLNLKTKRFSNKDNWVNERQTKKGFWASKLVEFCKRTDLHGYKYIVMEDLNVVERSFWALAVVVSTAVAAYFVVTAYRWYARNPIVTVIESTQGAIWDIPFPAVTICDLNVVSRRAARAFADNMTLPENVTADFVFDTIRLVPLLHSSYTITSDQKEDMHKLQIILDLNKVSIETLFRKLSPASSCGRLVQRCMWKNTMYRCDQLFKQVYTMLGLCCSFNYYAVESTDGNHIDNELFYLSTPRRVASCGYQTALTVLLNTDPDDSYSATVASQGALVFIDNTYNIPDMDSPVRMVNPSTEVLIALSPERTYTTSGIRAFSPEQRQCHYNDEVQIGEFRQYSFHNCMAFQKVKMIINVCECIPFYFPLKEYHRTCNFKDLECLEKALRPLSNQHNHNFFQAKVHKCLPECEHYDYPIEVALGKLAKNIRLSGLPLFNDVNLENRSLLNVFFNDLVSTRFRRDVYLNWQNILAAFGGLLSLMLGFTLISGFDLLLFLVLRVAYDTIQMFFTAERFYGNRIHVQATDKKHNDWVKKPFKEIMFTQSDFVKNKPRSEYTRY